MVRAIVDSVIRLAEAELPPRSLATLHRALSFPNPEFVMRQRMGRWTGATPEEICLIDRDDQGRLVFPRGAVGTLRAAFTSAGAELAFDDRRVRHEALDLPFSFTLRDYQEEAVVALVRHTQGTAVLRSLCSLGPCRRLRTACAPYQWPSRGALFWHSES